MLVAVFESSGNCGTCRSERSVILEVVTQGDDFRTTLSGEACWDVGVWVLGLHHLEGFVGEWMNVPKGSWLSVALKLNVAVVVAVPVVTLR